MGSEIQDTRNPECLLCAGECPECGFDIDGMRARVAELEAKLAESEDWKNSLANDVIRTSHENMELQAKLAAATKRAGEEQDGN